MIKLLLVEDEKRMAQALCEILRQENYQVDHFGDGCEGFLAAESGVYDLIILDVMLPGKNGFSIAREIRREGIRTPILMLTAKSEVDDKVEGLDCGADDYLTKPFMTKELLARLRALSRRNGGRAGWRPEIRGYFLESGPGGSYLRREYCTAGGKGIRHFGVSDCQPGADSYQRTAGGKNLGL